MINFSEHEKEVMNTAIKNYGVVNQSLKAMEELSELAAAISKIVISADPVLYFGNLIEEIADVEIMLYQLKRMFHVPEDALDKWKKFKINRLEDRINGK